MQCTLAWCGRRLCRLYCQTYNNIYGDWFDVGLQTSPSYNSMWNQSCFFLSKTWRQKLYKSTDCNDVLILLMVKNQPKALDYSRHLWHCFKRMTQHSSLRLPQWVLICSLVLEVLHLNKILIIKLKNSEMMIILIIKWSGVYPYWCDFVDLHSVTSNTTKLNKKLSYRRDTRATRYVSWNLGLAYSVVQITQTDSVWAWGALSATATFYFVTCIVLCTHRSSIAQLPRSKHAMLRVTYIRKPWVSSTDLRTTNVVDNNWTVNSFNYRIASMRRRGCQQHTAVCFCVQFCLIFSVSVPCARLGWTVTVVIRFDYHQSWWHRVFLRQCTLADECNRGGWTQIFGGRRRLSRVRNFYVPHWHFQSFVEIYCVMCGVYGLTVERSLAIQKVAGSNLGRSASR